MAGVERLSVAVHGAAGYVGGELLRLLLRHPGVGTVRAFSRSAAGRDAGEVHPALAHLPALRFEEPETVAADVVFFALPHGRSQEVMREALDAGPRLVVDLAADFRVRDEGLYEAHYGPHLASDLLPEFAYGLADVAGTSLAGRTRIAAPGCFATAALLCLRPLAREGLLDGPPACFAATGSSGSGARPKAGTHHPARAHNFYGYAPTGHRHEAEIADELRRWLGAPDADCRLLTHSAPLVRGIHATLVARLTEPVPDPLALLHETWAGSRFVVVRDANPQLAPVVGTNFAHTFAAPRAGGREVVVYTVIDNLVKGAAGQAIQCMNLALGLDEAAGLADPGIFPC
jgi:N-acetyl-gamma-glutamyl-phosphate reductase common form